MMRQVSRRDILRRGLAGGAAAAIASALSRVIHGGAGAGPAAKRPNVLLVVADDLRPQLGCYGKRQMVTPNLDRLAGQGTLFKRTYCQQPLCGPSRSSFLTGLRPDTIKIFDNATRLRASGPGVVTLPQHFKSNGYHTQSVGKIFHSFDEERDGGATWTVPTWEPEEAARYASPELREQFERLRAEGKTSSVEVGPRYERADVADNVYADGMLADRAVETLGQVKDKSFFLAVGMRKPHRPWAAPEKYWRMYDPRRLDLPDNFEPPVNCPEIALKESRDDAEGDDEGDAEAGVQPARRTIRPKEIRAQMHGYFACISYVDALIGRIVGELDRLGLGENTVVVVTSDHGFHLGENGQRAKSTLFTPSLHVPLIVRMPGGTGAGGRTAALTELVDIYPSLCDLCGITPPPNVEGTSFKPVLEDPDREWKQFAISQTPREDGKVMGYSMRTDRYRFNRWQWQDGSRVEFELYDQRKDPGETVNIAKENVETVQRLDRQLAKGWRGAVPA